MQNNVSISKTISNLERRGIDYEMKSVPVTDENGNVVRDADGSIRYHNTIIIKKVPESEAEVNRFFSLTYPCWFGGCEELRKEYKEALAKEGKDDCTDCQKGAIMRMFESRVRQAINAHHEPINTRPSEVSRPNGESNEGVSNSPSVLRRATDSIKKVFGLSKE